MMSDSKLSSEMLNLFRANMKLLSPDAAPTEFQQGLTQAISKGLIEVLQAAPILGIAPSPIIVGINGLGLIVQPDIMQKSAKAKMLLQTGGSSGSALDLILQTVMVSTAKHLAEAVEVISQNGYGGQGLPPTIEASVISASIIKNLPAQQRLGIAQSKHGADLINSIAFGFAAGLKLSVPGLVPFGTIPPPPGLMQAVLK